MSQEPEYEQRRKFARDLPVNLNEHELEIYGKQLAEKVKEEELLEEKKKADASKWSTMIKTVRQEVKRLADARSKGEELRPVMCAERLQGNVIEIVRLDTGSVVDSRPADLSDMQATLPNVDMDAGGDRRDNVLPFAPIDPGEPVDPGEGGEMMTSSSGDTVYVADQGEQTAEGELFDCGACGEKIKPDDEMITRDDIGVIHKDCDDEPDSVEAGESDVLIANAAHAQRERDVAQREAEIAADKGSKPSKPKRQRSSKSNKSTKRGS